MKSRILLILSSILMMLLIFTACAGAVENNPVDSPDQGNGSPSDDQGSPPSEDSGGELPPVAAVRARELLARTLGVDISMVEIIAQEQAEWMDSCLGLGGPAESCLQAVFPGWQVELTAEGETFIARTDELGESVRFENLDLSNGGTGILPLLPTNGDDDDGDSGDNPPSNPPVLVPGGSGPEAAEKARKALASKLGIGADQVEIVSYQQAEWPNGCLGLAGKGEMCTEAIVPGWRVELSAQGQTFIARTDQAGDLIRFE